MKYTDGEIREMDKEQLLEIVLDVRNLVSDLHFTDILKDESIDNDPDRARAYITGEIRSAVMIHENKAI